MTRGRRLRRATAASRKSAELAAAVPLVMTQRMMRMARAGTAPSARDTKEFRRMVAEKPLAFGEAWGCMLLQLMLAQQALAVSLVRAFWTPWNAHRATPHAMGARFHDAAMRAFDGALTPLHRAATANARRLSRRRFG